MDKVSILDALLAEEKKQVANALVEMHFASEDRIIQQGEPGNMCHGKGLSWGKWCKKDTGRFWNADPSQIGTGEGDPGDHLPETANFR